jgi:hypothetical protein
MEPHHDLDTITLTTTGTATKQAQTEFYFSPPTSPAKPSHVSSPVNASKTKNYINQPQSCRRMGSEEEDWDDEMDRCFSSFAPEETPKKALAQDQKKDNQTDNQRMRLTSKRETEREGLHKV